MSMSDRELLEMAAKALDDPKLFANNTGEPWQYWIGFCDELNCDITRIWNPLDDDGDALRLAVKLHIDIDFFFNGCSEQYDEVLACNHGAGKDVSEQIGFYLVSGQVDEAEATRRAIVRAAAEIGKSMQESKS